MSKIFLDITKPTKEIVIDKFNAISGIQLQYEYVVLGDVTPLTLPNDKEDTVIEILPSLVAPFLNKFHLKYKRMNLVDIFSAPYLNIASSGAATLYELLIDLNTVLGINIGTGDVEEAPVEIDLVTGSHSVFIKTKPTSILYCGEALVVLDVTLNAPTTTIETNSTIYILNKNSAGSDSITCHAFDGYKSDFFNFLNNVELVTDCKIDNIFTCENNIIVLDGQFSFIAADLTFIDTAVTYSTITLDKAGNVLSARQERTPLALVSKTYISTDVKEKIYYIVDKESLLSINNKNVYRLFQNGTIDNNFNIDNLPVNIVKIISSNFGFYTIDLDQIIYTVKRFDKEGIEDTSFLPVVFETNSGNFTTISGFTKLDAFGKETLFLLLMNDNVIAGNKPTIQALEVLTDFTGAGTSFYSPFFTIEDDGKRVVASGTLAKYNSKGTILNSDLKKVYLNNVHGGGAIYTLDNLSKLDYKTVTPLLIGVDQEYSLQCVSILEAENTTAIKNITQTSTGYETYVVVDVIDRISNEFGSAVLSFGPDHTFNGIVKYNLSNDVEIMDVVVLRR